MPEKNRLSVRIPFLMEAVAEGTLSVALVFVLVIAMVAIFFR
jgi:hypothetical protein